MVLLISSKSARLVSSVPGKISGTSSLKICEQGRSAEMFCGQESIGD